MHEQHLKSKSVEAAWCSSRTTLDGRFLIPYSRDICGFHTGTHIVQKFPVHPEKHFAAAAQTWRKPVFYRKEEEGVHSHATQQQCCADVFPGRELLRLATKPSSGYTGISQNSEDLGIAVVYKDDQRINVVPIKDYVCIVCEEYPSLKIQVNFQHAGRIHIAHFWLPSHKFSCTLWKTLFCKPESGPQFRCNHENILKMKCPLLRAFGQALKSNDVKASSPPSNLPSAFLGGVVGIFCQLSVSLRASGLGGSFSNLGRGSPQQAAKLRAKTEAPARTKNQ